MENGTRFGSAATLKPLTVKMKHIDHLSWEDLGCRRLFESQTTHAICPRNTLRVTVTPLWHLWCLYRATCAAALQRTPSSVTAGWIWQRALKSRGGKNILFTKQVLVSKGFSVSKQRLVGLCRSQAILVNTTAQGFQPENSSLDTVSATLSASV